MEQTNQEKAQGPCSGFRVMELGSMVAGPLAGQILADFGADVIKCEGLDGDIMRSIPPFHKGASGAFAQWNRSKRSIVADLRSPEGRAVAKRLALSSDVLYESYRPGVAEAMGLGYEALRLENPKLIYVSINGYGDDGPYADQPAYDLAIQGLAGFMPMQGEDAGPMPIKNVVVDKITGYSAAMSILAALLHRQKNGSEGQKINVTMLDAFSAFILPELMYNHSFEYETPASESVNNLYQTVETSDGHVIGLVGRDNHYAAFITALKRPDLADDPRFATTARRFVNARALMAEVQPVVKNMTKKEFIELMRAHSIPFAPVNSIHDFFEDPQVLYNKTYVEHMDPELGVIRNLNSFARFSATPTRPHSAPPKFGENTDEIMRDLAFEAPVIADYRARNIIR
jgi:crotonobetainyl-CoA:carnitine CoA-transferase CaiB-like acyl-CoA transferase